MKLVIFSTASTVVANYYPFGMPMPNRTLLGPEGYRYAFQGQEKDPETGKEAFQLRLWDGRIGRWLGPDPYRQYASPYLGMGNNPINGVDPDGGCFTTDKDGNTIPCPDMNVGSTMTGAAGYEWTMTDTGWDRSDGYGVDLIGNIPKFQIDGKDAINGAVLLYGVSQGAAGSVADFDEITNALKNDQFLSRSFNASGDLKSYQLNPDGSPKWAGRPDLGYSADDLAKEASKFRTKANLIKGIKALGTGANVVGVGLSVHQVYIDGELTFVNGMDTAMGLVAFIPGYGWVLSGSYSVMRLTVPLDYPTNISPTFHRFGE